MRRLLRPRWTPAKQWLRRRPVKRTMLQCYKTLEASFTQASANRVGKLHRKWKCIACQSDRACGCGLLAMANMELVSCMRRQLKWKPYTAFLQKVHDAQTEGGLHHCDVGANTRGTHRNERGVVCFFLTQPLQLDLELLYLRTWHTDLH